MDYGDHLLIGDLETIYVHVLQAKQEHNMCCNVLQL